jgi:hypothetical protein
MNKKYLSTYLLIFLIALYSGSFSQKINEKSSNNTIPDFAISAVKEKTKEIVLKYSNLRKTQTITVGDRVDKKVLEKMNNNFNIPTIYSLTKYDSNGTKLIQGSRIRKKIMDSQPYKERKIEYSEIAVENFTGEKIPGIKIINNQEFRILNSFGINDDFYYIIFLFKGQIILKLGPGQYDILPKLSELINNFSKKPNSLFRDYIYPKINTQINTSLIKSVSLANKLKQIIGIQKSNSKKAYILFLNKKDCSQCQILDADLKDFASELKFKNVNIIIVTNSAASDNSQNQIFDEKDEILKNLFGNTLLKPFLVVLNKGKYSGYIEYSQIEFSPTDKYPNGYKTSIAFLKAILEIDNLRN